MWLNGEEFWNVALEGSVKVEQKQGRENEVETVGWGEYWKLQGECLGLSFQKDHTSLPNPLFSNI